MNDWLPEHLAFAETYVAPVPHPWNWRPEDAPPAPDLPPAPVAPGVKPPLDPPIFLLNGSPASATPAVGDTQFQRVLIGNPGQVLTVDSGGNFPQWATGTGTGISPSGDTTGARDTAAINAALAVGNNPTVTLNPGLFWINGQLNMLAGTTFRGSGNGGTILRLVASTTVTSMISMNANQLNYSATILDMQLDGNQANSAVASHGIYMFAPSDCIVQRVRVINMSGNAITLDGSGGFLGTATKILDSFVRACGGNGLNVTAFTTDVMVTSCDFGSCVGHAFYFGGGNESLVGCIGWGSDTGVFLDSGAALARITGCRFDTNKFYGIWVKGSNVTIGTSVIFNNSVASSGSNPGVLVDTAASNVSLSNLRSTGGLISGSQQSYGIQLATGRAGPVSILGGDVTGNGTGGINVVGTVTGDRITNCRGYNPVGVVSPAVPGTGVAVAAINYDRTFYITNGAASSTFAISGGPTVTLAANAFGSVKVLAGLTLTPTYTSAPTWVVEGE